jgi:hypothetical protein
MFDHDLLVSVQLGADGIEELRRLAMTDACILGTVVPPEFELVLHERARIPPSR